MSEFNSITAYAEAVDELSRMPIRSDTLRSQMRRQDIENRLVKLEQAINIFNKAKVFVLPEWCLSVSNFSQVIEINWKKNCTKVVLFHFPNLVLGFNIEQIENNKQNIWKYLSTKVKWDIIILVCRKCSHLISNMSLRMSKQITEKRVFLRSISKPIKNSSTCMICKEGETNHSLWFYSFQPIKRINRKIFDSEIIAM